jgi:hypothetical protein
MAEKDKNDWLWLLFLLAASFLLTIIGGVFFHFPFAFLEPLYCIQIVGARCPPFWVRWDRLLLDFIFWLVVVFGGWGGIKIIRGKK